MLLASSFGKRSIKMPDLKSLRTFLPLRMSEVKGLPSKCTVLKIELLEDHRIYCLHVCM